MQKVFILMGLPGSGKSTVAKKITNYKELYSKYPSIYLTENTPKVFSSDEYREKLTGDVNNQTSNHKIFNTLYNDLTNHVKNGGSAIYDATNINRKNRKEILTRLNDLHIEDLKIIGILVITPIEECIERNKNRERIVPEEVIYNMACKFEMPLLNEGFSSIEYEYTFNEFYDPIKEFSRMRSFDQDNPNHTKNLDVHCFQSCMQLLDKTSNKELRVAALYHDIGKVFVAKYNEEKGYTQYIGHESYGAYRCMTMNYPQPIDPIKVALYVNYHMEIFKLKDAKEETVKKHKKLFSDETWKDLEMLREADLSAH